MLINKNILMRKIKITEFIVFLAIASVFLFPDMAIITYIGRLSIIVLFIIYMFQKGIIKNKMYFLWNCILSIILIVNLLFTINLVLTLDMIITMLTGMWAAFSLFELVKSKGNMHYIFKCIIVCQVIFCIRLVEHINFDVWGQRKVGLILGINVNAIGIRLVFAIVISLFFYYLIKDKKRYFYLITIILFMSMILITGSRRALILSIVAILIFMLKNSNNPINKIRTFLMIAMIMFAVYYLINNIPQLYSIIGERLNNFLTTLLSGDSSAFDDSRDLMAMKAIELFQKRPITGWGLGCFSVNSGYDIAYCHNNYAELLYALGFIGFIAYYLYIPISFIRIAFLKKHKQEFTLCICIVILLLLSDFAAVNATTFVTHIFIGILLTYIRVDMSNEY